MGWAKQPDLSFFKGSCLNSAFQWSFVSPVLWVFHSPVNVSDDFAKLLKPHLIPEKRKHLESKNSSLFWRMQKWGKTKYKKNSVEMFPSRSRLFCAFSRGLLCMFHIQSQSVLQLRHQSACEKSGRLDVAITSIEFAFLPKPPSFPVAVLIEH